MFVVVVVVESFLLLYNGQSVCLILDRQLTKDMAGALYVISDGQRYNAILLAF